LNAPSQDLLERLKSLAGARGWRAPEEADLEEPRRKFHGQAALVLRPNSTQEVAQIVQFCAQARVALVPLSGGTGLVGGQIMEEGPPPILLSLERMKAIRSLDVQDDAIVVEAGVVLADIQAAAQEAGRLFPLSLAAEGSCFIGGNLATNAGGVQVLRYGNARDLCLGIEAVLPDGSVYDGLKVLRKDNTGYDLRNLLIGSEGTLGVITAAALKLFPRPKEIETVFAAVPSAAAAVALLQHLRGHLGETLSAFELMSRQGMAFLAQHMSGFRSPLQGQSEWYLLMEAGTCAESGLRPALEAALETAFEKGLLSDATIAESQAQRDFFWRLREEMPLVNRIIGAVMSSDVSVPISRIPQFIEQAQKVIGRIEPELRINCYGHLGDGNLHYNIFPAEGRDAASYGDLGPRLMTAVHDLVHDHDGSFSAEHGVGRLKVKDLQRYGDPGKIAAMRAIKSALDPLGIMNPGAVLSLQETL
jgi:FAD/FMN-containing dehydrogenase